MTLYPETPHLLNLIESEVARHGGTIAERIHEGGRLFVRALLPAGREVRPRDFIGHGLAARTRGTQIIVHPYTFRQVCSNGAIHIDNIASRCVERSETPWEGAAVERELREAVEAGATGSVFESNLSDMERMMAEEVRMPLMMSRLLGLLGSHSLLAAIADRFLEARDRSLFGLMNAITSTARDEPEPEKRWNLEELGGGLLAVLRPPKPARTPGHAGKMPLPAKTQRKTAAK